MKEFKINEFLTVKLRGDYASIYVGDRTFNQCASLLINIPNVESGKESELDSVEEIVDKVGWSEEMEVALFDLDSESEFWGYCSNLQAWYEHDYDTTLLHRDFAFPLLKKLAKLGDPLAKRVFKQEIKKRFLSGYPNVAHFLLERNMLEFKSPEELKELLKKWFFRALKSNYKYDFKIFSQLLTISEENGLLKILFPFFLKMSTKMIEEDKYRTIVHLLDIANELELINQHYKELKKLFLFCWDRVDKSWYENNFPLIFAIKNSDLFTEFGHLIETYLLGIISDINNKGVLYKRETISTIIRMIKGTELFDKLYSHLVVQLPLIFDDIEKLPIKGTRNRSSPYFEIMKSIKDTPLWKKHYKRIENIFLSLLTNGTTYHSEYYSLLDLSEGTKLMINNFSNLMDYSNKLSMYKFKGSSIQQAFYALLKRGEKMGLIKDNIDCIKTQFFHLFNEIGKSSFDLLGLINVAKNFGWIEEFSTRIESNFGNYLDNLKAIPVGNGGYQYDSFLILIKVAKELGLMKEHLPTLMNLAEYLIDPLKSYESIHRVWADVELYIGFSALLKEVKNLGLLKKYYSNFVRLFQKLPRYHINFYFTFRRCNEINNFLEAVEGTDLKPIAKKNVLEYGFYVLLEPILKNIDERKDELSELFDIAKKIGFLQELKPFFLKNKDKIPDSDKYYAYFE